MQKPPTFFFQQIMAQAQMAWYTGLYKVSQVEGRVWLLYTQTLIFRFLPYFL